MRVLYFGTYDPTFARNALLLAGLRAVGVEVVECRAPLWRDTADKVAAARGAGPAFARRLATAWRQLLDRYRRLGTYDALVVGYAGHLDVLLARRLTRRAGRPLVLDAFLSLTETIEDRALARHGSLRWRGALLLDRLACRRSDRVLVDTGPHATYFQRALALPPARLAVVPMGAWPRRPLAPAADDTFEVLYYGGYIPLHGLEYILGAARALRHEAGVRFTLVGDGQGFAAAQATRQAWQLTNVRFARTWLPEDALVARYLAPAQVCLGVFGVSAKAARVLPAKVLLALAAGRPVVTRDSPAAREALVPERHALLCLPGDAEALAASLMRLRADAALRARLAAAGPPLIAARHTPAALGVTLRDILATTIAEHG